MHVEQGDLKRSFITFTIDPRQQQGFKHIRDDLADAHHDWLLTRPVDDHLSLVFTGSVKGEEAQDKLDSLLTEFAAKARPFWMHFDHVGHFENRRRRKPRDVLYFGTDEEAGQHIVENLHRPLALKVLRPNGFKFGRFDVVPHVTFGRIFHPNDHLQERDRILDRYRILQGEPALVTGFTLADSYTKKHPDAPHPHDTRRSKYFEIKRYEFGGEPMHPSSGLH
ncbi:MAG: 2'-5' RNA ligase family protein [Alphaproteobacteria bacterium]|nr:2'-5' RNA ligase family protein [Alphaproteobacteria bacterium]